jgi:hypothetical protein
MGIFSLKTHKSFGGRDANDQWSNQYFFALDFGLNSPELRSTVMYIKDAEQTAHLSEVHFMRGYVHQVAENTFNRPDKSFRTVEFDGRGARDVNFILDAVGASDSQFENPMMPEDICLVVKRETNGDRNGRSFYRNCLLRDDVKTGNDGEFVLVNASPFNSLGQGQDTMVEMFNAGLPNDAIFVLPNPVSNPIYQTGRPIVAHHVGGVSILKSDRGRTSSPAALSSSIQRNLNRLAKQAADIQAAQAATGVAPSGATVAELIDLAKTLVSVVPVGRASRVVVPQILRALPAGG